MTVTLNNRLIPLDLRNAVEERANDHSGVPGYVSFAYLDDPCDEVVVAVESEGATTPGSQVLEQTRRGMEEIVRDYLNGNGVLNLKNLEKPDGRIWVKPPVPLNDLYGLDVEFLFGGNPVQLVGADESRPVFRGTLNCAGPNEFDEISVCLITNQPLEDENGREVYRVDLDQASVDSLRRDGDDGHWTVRLPLYYRAIV